MSRNIVLRQWHALNVNEDITLVFVTAIFRLMHMVFRHRPRMQIVLTIMLHYKRHLQWLAAWIERPSRKFVFCLTHVANAHILPRHCVKILRFRMHKIGIISDIKQAFLNVGVAEEYQDFLRFLWFENPQEDNFNIICYKFYSIVAHFF